MFCFESRQPFSLLPHLCAKTAAFLKQAISHTSVLLGGGVSYPIAPANRLSVTVDYDCILAMLLGSSRNGRLEVTQFSVPTTSGNCQCNPERCKEQHIRADSTRQPYAYPMCEGQRWILNVPTILLWYTEPPSLGLDLKNPATLGLEAC